MKLDIALLPGDGIGPEVTTAAVAVLRALAERFALDVNTTEHPVGWAAIESHGVPLPEDTLSRCLEADAVFLGAVGDPRGRGLPPADRPEAGILTLRSALGCWANLRPLTVPDALVDASALRPEKVRGTSLLVVRELGGGLYYGQPRDDVQDEAWNTLRYSEGEVRRIAELAFELAAARRGHVTSVDKANVLEVSQLWRRVVTDVASSHEGVDVEHMYVDRAAMELVLRPTQFDVIVTGNLFGDILSDEAGALAGSLGVLGSASVGGVSEIYEPVHGSAPDIAGQGIANPVGAFASISMMLRHTYPLDAAADALDGAVANVFSQGIRTPDLASSESEASTAASTAASTGTFTDAVLAQIAKEAV